MVAKTPTKLRKAAAAAPLDPARLRETLMKVDKCVARLQELQFTVAGGRKVVSGVSLSPRSTRAYLRTSLRCKQESMRVKSNPLSISPKGKFPAAASGGEWRRTSLPAMLVGETMTEILQASKFTRDVVAAVADKSGKRIRDDPKSPITPPYKSQRPISDSSDLRTRRKVEKQNRLRSSELHSPALQRARSRINFKVSPPKQRNCDKGSARYSVNRVSPRNKPWAKKTVLFPNPLFSSNSPTTKQPTTFTRTKSPVIMRKRPEIPHKFLIKSPNPPPPPKFQVKIKSPPKVCRSLTRNSSWVTRKSPQKLSTAEKLRRSFSPSRLASRLISPLKGRISIDKGSRSISGLKQRPPGAFTPARSMSRKGVQVIG
ncbi:hypothetical protein MLD38_035901 [Melastoma candidum]|uniref:Uncharacterized protein n=1 Tax=Melastoma candidum TaxID=119954 RepID=A0ACB9LI08_9MYRT|nr:hypothetical protein MLD38_035901 [Melastoma candidum]